MTHFQVPQELFHEKGYKQTNGISHFYRIVGTGEPFVFLHGVPGMWHDELVPSFLNLHKIISAFTTISAGMGTP